MKQTSICNGLMILLAVMTAPVLGGCAADVADTENDPALVGDGEAAVATDQEALHSYGCGYGSSPGGYGYGSIPGGYGYGSSPGGFGYGSTPGGYGYGSSYGSFGYSNNPGGYGYGRRPGGYGNGLGGFGTCRR